MNEGFERDLPAHARPPGFERLMWEIGVGALLALGAIVSFMALAHSIFHGPLDGFDRRVEPELHRTAIVTPFIWLLTWLGNARTLLPGFLVVLWMSRARRRLTDALALASVLVLANLLDEVAKFFFARPRPVLPVPLVHESGYSFPSGHAITALCFYGFVAYLVWVRLEWRTVSWLVPLLELVILAIGFSRIYLGAHYPSDVLGGYLLGIPVLVGAVLCHRLHLYRKFFKHAGSDESGVAASGAPG
jgi:undecaprenyl-diphosphatase